MLVLYVILGLCALLGAAFGYLYSRSSKRLPSHAQFLSSMERGPDHYRHLERLFSAEDFAFVERAVNDSDLQWRLLRERRRLLRVVLAQLREEFEGLMAIGSMLAVSSAAQSERVSGMLVRQTVTFYSRYLRMILYSYSPWAGPGGAHPAPLLEQVRSLRVDTRRVIAALTPQDLDQLRATFTSRS